MFAFFRHELKSGIKSLFIWAIAVGGMGLVCILLYKSMEGSMAEMAESMASMGSFSDAFGMSTLSIATLKGYFATEIGTIHELGSSLFAASIATVMLSKEEDAHNAEFTFTLPISRNKIIGMKYLNVLVELIIFTIICGVLYFAGFVALGDTNASKELVSFMLFQLIMNVEIAAICLFISAISKKNRIGLGISVGMLLYAYDLMARVVPKLKDVKFISPFSYANATAIFAGEKIETSAIILGGICILLFIVLSWIYYAKKDLAS